MSTTTTNTDDSLKAIAKDHLIRKLRIKIASLAYESRLIRKEARKTKHGVTRASLQAHRVYVVRRELRTAQLAYALVRGVPYWAVEHRSHFDARFQWQELLVAVERQVTRLRWCGLTTKEHREVFAVDSWLADAQKWLELQHAGL